MMKVVNESKGLVRRDMVIGCSLLPSVEGLTLSNSNSECNNLASQSCTYSSDVHVVVKSLRVVVIKAFLKASQHNFDRKQAVNENPRNSSTRASPTRLHKRWLPLDSGHPLAWYLTTMTNCGRIS